MLNLVAIQGRLTAKPELKVTQSGVDVTTFTLAVQRDKDNTDFIECVAWRDTAKFVARYFDKGAQMIVSGNLRTRTYEAKDGSKRKAVEVLCSKVDFCGSKTEQSTQQGTAPHFEEIKDDEFPF